MAGELSPQLNDVIDRRSEILDATLLRLRRGRQMGEQIPEEGQVKLPPSFGEGLLAQLFRAEGVQIRKLRHSWSLSAATTVFTALGSGSCSQSRITCQPALLRASLAWRSRSIVRLSFGAQYQSFTVG